MQEAHEAVVAEADGVVEKKAVEEDKSEADEFVEKAVEEAR